MNVSISNTLLFTVLKTGYCTSTLVSFMEVAWWRLVLEGRAEGRFAWEIQWLKNGPCLISCECIHLRVSSHIWLKTIDEATSGHGQHHR